MNTCEFCKDQFTNKGNLYRHQRSVKTCIEIQEARRADIISSKYECHYCKKHLCSKDRLHYHMNICRMKPSEAKPNEVKLNEDVNDPTKPIINQSHNTTQNQSHNTTNTQSQNSNEHSFNTNYISIVQYMTPDRVEETFSKNYTLSDLMGSQKALAEFTSEHFLNGADKPAYICTDRSRHHFAYMDETKGQIEDVNANMLIRLAMRGFETVTDTYKTKMIELEKKLKIYEKEDAATLVVDIRNQINDLKDNYAKTMNISKEGEGYRSKLSQILPASLVKKTYEEEIFEQLRLEDEAHAEKKRLAKLKKEAEAAVASPATNQINEAYNNALKTYRANPDKIFPLVKNADGQRLVCGITAGKLSIFRTFFRNEGIIKLSPLLNGSPEKIEEYIYWIHEEV